MCNREVSASVSRSGNPRLAEGATIKRDYNPRLATLSLFGSRLHRLPAGEKENMAELPSNSPGASPLAPTPAGPGTPDTVERAVSRNVALALGRGLLGRCPKCGKGAMFRAYLSVNPRCPVCGEDLSPQRADDAPAFLTLLVACLVGCAGVLLTDDASSQMPLLAVALFWLVVTAVASLLVLPRIKGAVIGGQWALRMHGFGKRPRIDAGQR
jgi:uncharacterized protein (DUF983 family)